MLTRISVSINFKFILLTSLGGRLTAAADSDNPGSYTAHASLELGMGGGYPRLEVAPYLVGSFFDLPPRFAAGPLDLMHFFRCRTLFCAQLVKRLGTLDPDVSPGVLYLGFH